MAEAAKVWRHSQCNAWGMQQSPAAQQALVWDVACDKNPKDRPIQSFIQET